MLKRNADNERIKRKYLIYLLRSQGKSESSIDIAAAAIDRFLEANRHKPLKRFHLNQATSFRDKFEAEANPKTGKLLSRSTITTALRALRSFFKWLADQPGYKSRIGYSDAEYFTPSRHDERIARATRNQYIPTLEQIHHVISQMPSATEIERRDRALIAFTILACPRDSATASIKLKHVNLAARKVLQDGAEMKTKFRKTFSTFFYPVGGKAENIVSCWVKELQQDHLFGHDDPLFPKTRTGRGTSGGFEVLGLDRSPWRNTSAICKIFRKAFEAAGLSYANPHSFRHTLGSLVLESDLTPAGLKAWSQNLGHEKLITTLLNYAKIPEHEQGALITNIKRPDERDDRDTAIAKIKKAAVNL